MILQKVEIKLSQNNRNDSNNRLPLDKKKKTKKQLLKKTSTKKLSDSISLSENHNSTLEKVEKLQWHLMVNYCISFLIFLDT